MTTKKFADLNIGDVFLHENILMAKSEFSTEFKYNAETVEHQDGWFFNDDEEVFVLSPKTPELHLAVTGDTI